MVEKHTDSFIENIYDMMPYRKACTSIRNRIHMDLLLNYESAQIIQYYR